MRNKTNTKLVPLLISLIFTVQLILVPSVALAWVKSDGFGADTYNGVMTTLFGEGESPYGESSQVYGTGSGISDDYENVKENDSTTNSYGQPTSKSNEPKIDWIKVAAQIKLQLEETNTLSPLIEGLALQMGYVRVPVLGSNSTRADGTYDVDSPLNVQDYEGVHIPDPDFSFKNKSMGMDADFLASRADSLAKLPGFGSFFSQVSNTIRDNWSSNNSIAENIRNTAGALLNNGRELADAAIDTFVAGVTSAAGAVATAVAGTAGYAMTMAKTTGRAIEQTGGRALDIASSRAYASTETKQPRAKINSAFFKGIDPSLIPKEPSNTLLDRLMDKNFNRTSPFQESFLKAMESFAQKESPTGGGGGVNSSSSSGSSSSYSAPPMSSADYARAKASVGSIPNFTNYVDAKVVQTIKNWVASVNGDYVGQSLTNLASTIAYYAKEHKVDPLIMTALLTQESGFNPTARSHCGATGIAQFMPETAAGMGVDPYDVTSSINGACEYISNMMKSFGDYSLALAGYNAGGGAVEKYGGIPPYSETVNYVNSITDMWSKLKHQYDSVFAA